MGLILLLIVLLALLYALYLTTRRRTLWVKREGEEKSHRVPVSGVKKTALDVVRLPNYHLKLGTYPHEILKVLIFKNEEKPEKVRFGEAIKCETPQGDISTIVVHGKLAQAHEQKVSPEEEKKKGKPDDFLKEKSDKALDPFSNEYESDIE